MKVRNVLIWLVLALLLSTTAFATPDEGSLPLAQAGNVGLVSSPAITKTAAAAVAAYWSPQAMAAAIPMDMEIEKSSNSASGQAPMADSIALSGAPVLIDGNQPGKAPGGLASPTTLSGLEAFSSPASAVYSWYSYPFPYTKSNLGGAWPTYYPLRTNGKVFFTQLETNYVCSGTSTTSGSGGNRRLVWTAGHCAHAGNNSSSGWSTNVLFCPAYYFGAGPWGCWTVIENWTFWGWYSAQNLKYDQGVFITSDTSTTGYGRLGDVIGTQGLSWSMSYVEEFWEFGYPAASPYSGNFPVLTTSSTAVADDPNGAAGPYTIGVGSDMTGGSSGGGWIIYARLGNWGYLNSVNSYKYISPSQPFAMYGPYFDAYVSDLWNAVRTLYP